MATAAAERSRRGSDDPRPLRLRRLLVACVGGLLAAYTAATIAEPALQLEVFSPDLRIVIETVGLCVALFAVLALLLPDEDQDDPARNAFVAALLTLGVSNAVFGIGPLLVAGEAAGAQRFYPWVAARYVAGILFIVASLRRPALGLRGYVLTAAGTLALVDLAFLALGERLPLPLTVVTEIRGGSMVRVSTLAENTAIAALPGALFAVGALLAWRVYVRRSSSMYLWLSLALWVLVLAQIHEVFYPAILGPVVTSADLLRAIALLLILIGALLKVRRLALDRAAAVRAQASDLEAQQALLAQMRDFTDREEAFRSLVTHELATPIAALRAFAHVLTSTRPTGDGAGARTAVAGIDGESRRLQQLVRRMEELRHLELDEFSCDLRSVRLRPLLDDAATFVRGLPGGHVPVVTCPDIRVAADPVRLGQALRNVLTNAARYSPDRSCILVEGRAAGDRGVQIVVTDQGPGIPAEERQRILDKYERGSAGQHARGAGLGLYVARRIVEAHGGRLYVSDGADGSGACVVLELRTSRDHAAAG